MAKPSLLAALDNVEATYADVVEIANDMLNDIFAPIDSLINEIRDSGAGASIETVRDYIIRLQLRAYEISDIKEKSTLKAECAEALREEKYAQVFNSSEGTAGAKSNTALLAASEETIVEALFNLVASRLKTKLDQLHRMVDALKSILMSKMQEAKLAMNGIE